MTQEILACVTSVTDDGDALHHRKNRQANDPMKTLNERLRTLDTLSDREVGPSAFAALAGATVNGYTVRKNRRKGVAYIDVKVTVQVPLEPETAVRRPGERRG